MPVYTIAEKLRNRELSSLEVTGAYLGRIKEKDGKIRSFINVFEDLALEMAADADRRIEKNENLTPLTGIPMAVKDNICLKGFPATCASKILQNFIPPYDAGVIDRLKQWGAVIIGKTNMDEFAMGSSTENSRFFTSRNPWDTERVPGGSSGGSTAAVALGLVPAALGSDTGGSIRQPAAFCGVTGMKPTYGAVSRYGLVAFASSLDQIGPITGNVLDGALLLDCIAGHDPRDSTSVKDIPHGFFNSSVDTDIKGLKIGLPAEFFEEGLQEDIAGSLEDAMGILKKLGAEFKEISIPALKHSLAAYYILAPSEASSNLARYDGERYGYRDPDDSNVSAMHKKTRREGFGDEVLRRIMIGTYALSSGYYDAYYLKAQKVRTLIKQGFDEAFKQCDLLMSPATPTTAFKIGEKAKDPVSMYLSDIYTVSLNMAGLPGLVVPGRPAKDGLPVGIQFMGRAFDEKTLLRVGTAFQDNTHYHRMKPPIF